MRMITGKLNVLILALGTVVQVTGHILYLRSLLLDPIYALLLTAGGYIALATVCVTIVVARTRTESLVLGPSGEPLTSQIPKYSRNQRVVWGLVLLVASLTFTAHTIRSMSGSPHRQVAGPDKNSRDEYLETTGIFSLLGVSDVRWIGGGAFAHTEGSPSKTYPLAIIIEPTPQRISTFFGTACALTFQLEVPPRLPWVVIDEIVVIVNSYLPLQEYDGIYVKPFENAHVYYVEINKPLPNQREFRAEYIFRDREVKQLGIIRLERGKPEIFVVRINARTPGIYNFDVHLLVSHKDSKARIPVARSAEFLFDQPNGADRLFRSLFPGGSIPGR